MIIGSLNIRGGGNVLKRRLKSLMYKGNADVFMFQETKISNLQDFVAKSFWNNINIGYSFSNSVDMAGGLLTIWKEKEVDVINIFKGVRYLGIKFQKEHKFYYSVNIYSSCDLTQKRILWRKLLDLKEVFNDGEWIMGGNFNAIKDRNERKGRTEVFNHNDINYFADFIHESRLVDLPCKGKKYTWYSGDRKSRSRIDRFLISDKVVNDWGWWVNLWVIEIFMTIALYGWKWDNKNWGHKSFKFNNEWFSFKFFIPFVESEWKGFKVEGRGDFVLKEKLYLLKGRLQWWNKEVFRRTNLDVEEGVQKINLGDLLLEVEEEVFTPA
ncbi:uncharacterized protein LOC131614567 [Vicia villosa]|uniref:uncharacterized protein LOC131614567 n=1 Tax=Vicia villosa TaxID=3911 RepID=UPI00273B8C84|nr:uncharacterized protein LOC131614567 [Vicia villosa]